MSEQHTQDQLMVHTDGADGWPLLMIGGPAGRIVANVNPESGVDTIKAPSIAFKKMPAEANARRMAACWNHCRSVSTEDLEAMDRPGDVSWAAAIDRMVRERAELLAAARETAAALDALLQQKPMLAATVCGSTTLGNHRVQLHAAIKKAAGA